MSEYKSSHFCSIKGSIPSLTHFSPKHAFIQFFNPGSVISSFIFAYTRMLSKQIGSRHQTTRKIRHNGCFPFTKAMLIATQNKEDSFYSTRFVLQKLITYVLMSFLIATNCETLMTKIQHMCNKIIRTRGRTIAENSILLFFFKW